MQMHRIFAYPNYLAYTASISPTSRDHFPAHLPQAYPPFISAAALYPPSGLRRSQLPCPLFFYHTLCTFVHLTLW